MNKLYRFMALFVIVILVAACGPAAAPEPAKPAAEAEQKQEPATEPAQAAEPTKAPEPTPTLEPTAAPTEASNGGKVLKIRLPSDMTNADPAFHPARMDTTIAETVGEGLVQFKPGTWEVENVLAEEIKQSEDGLTIEFKLKEGVQFQKGFGELTAEDVKYSYERFIDPELEAPYKGDWENLGRVEVTGKYTGKIILTKPFSPLWTSTLPVTAGVIVSKKAVEEKGVKAYATDPVGSGPYEFGEWKPNEKVVLKRFEGYWGNKPEWDEIQLIPIVDNSAAEIALETGAVDFAEIPLDAIDRFEQNDKFEVIKIDTLNYNGLLMNFQHPKLQDINVRQAIRYAVDVPAIIEAAYDGKFARQCALLAPGQIGYWPDEPCYERDLIKAQEFLSQAGLDKLDLTLTIYNDEVSKTVAEVIQANLAELGINVTISPQDDAGYWDGGFGDKGIKERELTYIEWTTTNPDPSWTSVWFTCDQVGQYNWVYWCDEQFTKLHQEAISEFDAAKRTERYIEMQKLWDQAVHTVWVAHPTAYFAVRQGLSPAISPNAFPIVGAFSEE
jgi:peptide/nickel transport system substrate-binding protein